MRDGASRLLAGGTTHCSAGAATPQCAEWMARSLLPDEGLDAVAQSLPGARSPLAIKGQQRLQLVDGHVGQVCRQAGASNEMTSGWLVVCLKWQAW